MVYNAPIELPGFFAIRLSQEDGIRELNDFYSKKDIITDFIIDGLTHHRDKITNGALIFLVASGWKKNIPFSYTQGLYGVARVTALPYDDVDKEYTINVQFMYFFKRVLTRQDFLNYPNTADIPYIGPSTKGTKTQAISMMTKSQVEAVLVATQLMTKEKISIYSQYFPWFFKSSYKLSERSFTKMTDAHTPSLKVVVIARVFAEFIQNYSHKDTATMMGIFGKWGRGKTFFYTEIKKAIIRDKKENEEFFFCEFQPWKYEEKESAWAYLYQTVLNNYLNTNPWSKGFFHIKKYSKLAWLNLQKTGLLKISIFLLAILGIYLFSNLIPVFFPSFIDVLPKIVKPIGGLGIMIYVTYSLFKNYKSIALNTVNKYTKNHYFSTKLGFQNEIQEELKLLLKVFINTPESKKLILFIDDLDRCNEKMLISIIDSLRLMLDDEEIRERLIILTALDERILLKAIQHKYIDNTDGTMDDKMKVSSNEYIEKFFLMGIKLNELAEDDIIALVDNYTSTIDRLHKDSGIANRIDKKQSTSKNFNENENMYREKPRQKETPKNVKNIEPKDINNNEYIMGEGEKNYFKRHIIHVKNITPRKINMYIHRYLFFRALARELIDSDIMESIDSSLCMDLIFLIAENIPEYDSIVKKIRESTAITTNFSINNREYNIPTIEALKLLKITEMVSPF